jgi:hypothetical protein
MNRIYGAMPYLAWPASSLLTILGWVAIRDLIIGISIKATEVVPFEQQVQSGFLHKWVIPAVDGFSVLLCGIGAFGLVLAFEPIYRKAQQQGVLLRRFGTITILQVLVIIACRLLSLALGT